MTRHAIHFSVWFLTGIILFHFSRESHTGLAERVVRTARFEKAVRQYDIGAINQAINKIGTGRAHEHHLTGRNNYSVRVGRSGRIIYTRRNGNIVLEDYTASHDYKRH